MLEERKRELQQQQRGNESEHLQILRTIAEHDTVDFRQSILQERHAFQKALLQEVRKNHYIEISAVCVCVCVCVCACAPACVPACVRACAHVCVRVCVHACVRACVRVHARALQT